MIFFIFIYNLSLKLCVKSNALFIIFNMYHSEQAFFLGQDLEWTRTSQVCDRIRLINKWNEIHFGNCNNKTDAHDPGDGVFYFCGKVQKAKFPYYMFKWQLGSIGHKQLSVYLLLTWLVSVFSKSIVHMKDLFWLRAFLFIF